MTINNTFNIGQIVYLKTDIDQFPRIITAIVVNKSDLSYQLTCIATDTYHYDYEITSDKDVLMSLGVESGKESN